MNELSAVLAGYSTVACLILCAVYLMSLPDMHKSTTGKIACAGLMLPLAAIQVAHVIYFMHDYDLLGSRAYVFMLGVIPMGYYLFSREILRLSSGVKLQDLLYLTPLLAVLVLPLKVAALTAFVFGCACTSYIFTKTLRLRTHIPRYQFEKFFFMLFFGMNVLALAIGLSMVLFDPVFFYHAYAGAISMAMILVTTALLVFPELLSDVLLASETVYAKSKLDSVDVHKKREQLEHLMCVERCFEDENLTLGDVATQLALSPQQLSELVNSSFAMGFPRYVRGHRVDAAKIMLLKESDASVLSISMATGFKSQSSFYTAFKEVAHSTPAAFRKENRPGKASQNS